MLTKIFPFAALTKVYEKANSVLSYDVSCPTWLHKYIIGKKGSSIQKLTNELPKVSLRQPVSSSRTLLDENFCVSYETVLEVWRWSWARPRESLAPHAERVLSDIMPGSDFVMVPIP